MKKKQFEVEFKCSVSLKFIINYVLTFNGLWKKNRSKTHAFFKRFKNPDGRLEKIYDKNDIRVYVDYANTADALSKVLYALKQITLGKLFLVFGCGGDRDRDKKITND